MLMASVCNGIVLLGNSPYPPELTFLDQPMQIHATEMFCHVLPLKPPVHWL